MSNRSGFLEGMIVGAVMSGAFVLMGSPSLRRKVYAKIDSCCNDVQRVMADVEDPHTLIEKTKQSIEDGFERLTDMINRNQSSKQADDDTNASDHTDSNHA